MTEEQILEAARRGAREALEEDRRSFYVAPEEHYNHHQFIEKAINFLDKTTGTIWGTIIRAVVMVLLAALVVGVVTMGWKHILTDIGREVIK